MDNPKRVEPQRDRECDLIRSTTFSCFDYCMYILDHRALVHVLCSVTGSQDNPVDKSKDRTHTSPEADEMQEEVSGQDTSDSSFQRHKSGDSR